MSIPHENLSLMMDATPEAVRNAINMAPCCEKENQ